jgi:hypothetical protein
MVLALLAGRKVMTRRLAWQEPHKAALVGCDYSSEELEDFDVQGWNVELRGGMTYVSKPTPWQRVAPGDRLWVRESLTHVTSDPVTARPCSVHCYTANIPPGMTSANPYEPNYLFSDDGEPNLKPKGIPSIHMPRWASRLTLTVTATKVERLQMIRRADIIAEGVTSGSPVEFTALWDSLHGDGAWAANPEVVALSFTVEQRNIDAGAARV